MGSVRGSVVRRIPGGLLGLLGFAVLPPWAAAENRFFENLRDPAMRAKIRAEALNPSGDWEAMVELCGAEGVMPIGLFKEENQRYLGKTLGHRGVYPMKLSGADMARDFFKPNPSMPGKEK